MGQIVIDIPNRTTRRYVVADSSDAEALLKSLDDTAFRLPSNAAKLTRQQIEDIEDGQRADRILADMRRTGISYSMEEVRARLGL